MSPTNSAEFVRTCLTKLSAIDEQIFLLDPVTDKEVIALLREESLRIQLSADKELAPIT